MPTLPYVVVKIVQCFSYTINHWITIYFNFDEEITSIFSCKPFLFFYLNVNNEELMARLGKSVATSHYEVSKLGSCNAYHAGQLNTYH